MSIDEPQYQQGRGRAGAGHNAGVLSYPGQPQRHYRIAVKPADSRFVDPEQWLARNPPREGSWWPVWESWLAARSGPAMAPPPLGFAEKGYPALADAPGAYVLMA